MPLIRPDKACHPINEGDPLPPDDVVPMAKSPSIEHVYRTERPRLLRFLARRSRDQDADDLLQQSFVRVLAKTADQRPRIWNMEGYLFRTARHVAVDEARSVHRQNKALHLPIEDAGLLAPDQVAALEARDMLNRLEAVMQRLKPRTREIFLAHRIDGYTYGEIAARTGLSVKGVEKHMTRAIAAIDRTMRQR